MDNGNGKRWTADVGPRQRTVFVKALNALDRETRTHVELTGVVGGEEHRWGLYCPFGGGPINPKAVELYAALGERFGWTATRENFREIIAAAEAATREAAAAAPVVDKRRSPEAEAETTRKREEESARYRVEGARQDAAWAALLAKRPPGAAALIVAEYEEDKSDSQSDYSGSVTLRTVAIGWRTGAREDFRQLREVAARFPETEHLGPGRDRYEVVLLSSREECGLHGNYGYAGESLREPGHVSPAIFTTEAAARAAGEAAQSAGEAPDGFRLVAESVEHRENYSMGGGNYLKSGSRYSTGWNVSSVPLEYDGKPASRPSDADAIEDRLPAVVPVGGRDVAAPESVATVGEGEVIVTPSVVNGANVEIRFPAKPGEEVRQELKRAGFRWSGRSGVWYGPAARLPARYRAGASPEGSAPAASDGLRDETPEEQAERNAESDWCAAASAREVSSE